MKRWLLLFAAVVCPTSVFAQAQRIDNYALINTGSFVKVASGAVVTVCTSTGTGQPCTPLATTYTSVTLATPTTNTTPGLAQLCGQTPSTNPCLSDSNGNFGFWVTPGPVYIVTLTGAGVTPSTYTITSALTGTGNNTFTGTQTFSGTFTQGNTVWVGTGGSLISATATCAALALPSCTIDMRSGLGSHILAPAGYYDPGQNVAIKLLLGPFSDYTAIGFVLRNGFWMEGAGGRSTTITSIGTNAQPLFTIPQSNNQPAQSVTIRAVALTGLSGNSSQDGFFLDCSSTTNTGLWYSNFDDILMQGFKGVAFHSRNRPNDFLATNQFNTYRNLTVFRVSGGGEAVRIEGGGTNETFLAGEFDGAAQGDGSNIYLGTFGGSAYPNSIRFYGTTSQNANIVATINGVRHVYFHGMHHEKLNGGYNITFNASALNNGISIEDSYFATTGVNAGAGYLVQNNDSQASYVFKHNNIITAPDKMIIGTTGDNSDICCNPPASTPGFNWLESGTMSQMNPLATLNIQHYRIILLNASATVIATLQGMHAAGESVTFVGGAGGAVSFSSAGNLTLGGYGSPLILQPNATATFQRDSLNTNWHLVSVSGNVLPDLVVDTTGLNANVGSTNLLLVPTGTGQPTGGMYRLCGYTTVTTAAGTSSTLPIVIAGWTDRDSNTAITVGVTPSFATFAGSAGQTSNANGGNTLGTMTSGCIPISAKANTFISYSTSGYASNAAAAMVYALHIRLEAM